MSATPAKGNEYTMSIEYRFALELRRKNGEELGQFPAEIDWEPARHAAYFDTLRRNGSASFNPGTAPWTPIRPVWEHERGEPYVEGVDVDVPGSGNGTESTRIPFAYFADYAQGFAAQLVNRKVLQRGELYRYSVTAYANGATPTPDENNTGGLYLEDQSYALRLGQARFRDARESSDYFGTEAGTEFQVICPREILDETARLTCQAGAKETGGILIGNLYRDTSEGDIFAQVTDQIPALHNQEELTRLTFTPETWATTKRAIELRGKDELWLGWWHSHPSKFWCNPECPPEARKVCPLKGNFFSAQDVTLHRSVFPWAFCLALVVTHGDDGIEYAMFGWRDGIVSQRGFRISGGSQSGAGRRPSEAVLTQGNCDEKHS
jgi:hypothetical protein